MNDKENLIKEIERLKKENDILKKCVEFYAKGEIENARSYLINSAIDKKDAEIERYREVIESYCVCTSMGSSGGQCCFCEDLRTLSEVENG